MRLAPLLLAHLHPSAWPAASARSRRRAWRSSSRRRSPSAFPTARARSGPAEHDPRSAGIALRPRGLLLRPSRAPLRPSAIGSGPRSAGPRPGRPCPPSTVRSPPCRQDGSPGVPDGRPLAPRREFRALLASSRPPHRVPRGRRRLFLPRRAAPGGRGNAHGRPEGSLARPEEDSARPVDRRGRPVDRIQARLAFRSADLGRVRRPRGAAYGRRQPIRGPAVKSAPRGRVANAGNARTQTTGRGAAGRRCSQTRSSRRCSPRRRARAPRSLRRARRPR